MSERRPEDTDEPAREKRAWRWWSRLRPNTEELTEVRATRIARIAAHQRDAAMRRAREALEVDALAGAQQSAPPPETGQAASASAETLLALQQEVELLRHQVAAAAAEARAGGEPSLTEIKAELAQTREMAEAAADNAEVAAHNAATARSEVQQAAAAAEEARATSEEVKSMLREMRQAPEREKLHAVPQSPARLSAPHGARHPNGGRSQKDPAARQAADESSESFVELERASEDDLREYGLSLTQAKRLLAYRDDGFFEKLGLEAIEEIPGLPKALRQQLRERLSA